MKVTRLQNLVPLNRLEQTVHVKNHCHLLDTNKTLKGVVNTGEKAIKDVPIVFKKFREHGKKIYFVTNNSTKTREEVAKKLNRLNVCATPDEVIVPSYVAAQYLKAIKFNKKVYIIGRESISTALNKVGIEHTGVGPEHVQIPYESYVKNLKLDRSIGAVIVGFDVHFSFPKLVKAMSYINVPGTLFIATNPETHTSVGDVIVPLNGTFLKAIEYGTRKEALLMGKPSYFLVNYLLKEFGINPKRTLMIGDRLNSDILFGNRCGCSTLLVLSGETHLCDVKLVEHSKDPCCKDLMPNYYVHSLADMLIGFD